MTQPLVSVLTITYNQAPFIAETIESALAQDYAALEVVVADDGSTDGTAELVAEYGKRYPGKVIALVGGPNLGFPGNSNRGLRACRGAYVAIQGGDDLFLPGKISAQVRWLEAQTRRVLCGHDAYIFDSDTGRNLRRYTDLSRWREGAGPSEFLARGCPYLPSAVMLRRSAIPEHGFDERIRTVVDEKLFIDCLLSGGAHGHVDGIFARYRRHSSNMTTSRSERIIKDHFEILTLTEATSPALVGACQRGRARLHLRAGLIALNNGLANEARRHMRTALAAAPFASWKLPAWYALTLCPPIVGRRIFAWRRSKTVAVDD
jgi:glycosyltransferase involved in cell wall biosynthesis